MLACPSIHEFAGLEENERVDVSGMDLTKKVGFALHFNKIDLSGANLSETSFILSDFSESLLINANFSEAILITANFSNSNLSGANLTYTNIRCANLLWADLRNAKITFGHAEGAILIGVKGLSE